MFANLFVVLFNLIPAFPMDGGRVLRALLAARTSYARATRSAAFVGQAIAVVFGFIGLFANPFLVLIALFIWMGAAQESQAVTARSSLSGIPVHQAMITNFQVLKSEEPLSRAIDLILQGSQQDFPVLEENRLAGILTRSNLIAGLANYGANARVADIMRREFPTADASETRDTLLSRLQPGEMTTVPVVSRNAMIGLVTAENLSEFLLIRRALDQGARREIEAAKAA